MRPLRLLALVLAGLALVALTIWLALNRTPPPPTPNVPGTFSFAAFGDAPYSAWENGRYRVLLEDIAAHDLAAVVHVGDLFWTSCTRARYLQSLEGLNELPHPVVYTPGDNEWTDCWGHVGGFTPLDRLAEIREIFFDDPDHSLGGQRMPVLHQGDPFPEFVENARWVHDQVVFATLHLVGSKNGMDPFSGRTPADDAESRRRTEAAAAWLRDTFAEANARAAQAVVLVFHANPLFDEPVEDDYRQAFEPFLETLEQEVERFGLPVLAIHGDWHEYTVDKPLTLRSDGRSLDNFTRLQVPGSPDIGWVRVAVDQDSPNPFSFELRVIPFWR